MKSNVDVSGLNPISGIELQDLRQKYPVGRVFRAMIAGQVCEGTIVQVAECFPCEVWSQDEGVEKRVPAIRRYMVWVKFKEFRRKVWIELQPNPEMVPAQEQSDDDRAEEKH
jgi:hypothetical protein